MRFVGLNLGHDTGAAIFDQNGELIFYAQSERYTPRTKVHCFNIDPITEAFPHLKLKSDDILVTIPLVEKNLKHSIYDPRLIRTGEKGNNYYGHLVKEHLVIDHHFSHAIASWCFRNDDEERLFLSYDGAGVSPDGYLKYSLVGTISGDSFAVCEDYIPIPSSIPVCKILGENSAGKAMGLAGYLPDAPPLIWDDVNFMTFINAIIDPSDGGEPRHPRIDEPLTPEKMSFVASFYKYIMRLIGWAVKENIRLFANGRGVVLGGGSALALELNTEIYHLAKDVVFGPPINDSGLALGAAAFAYYHVNKKWPKLFTPSLNALQIALPKVGPQTIEEIASLLADNKVIALLRGLGEAGPRALGFRSILASANDANNLKRVSQDIKEREFYRPLAPIVTAEHFDTYFDGPKGEYMQYRVKCKDLAQDLLPAIVHKDLSARPQVVYKEQDPWLHSLLMHYGQLTGSYCLINTSLNGPGKPICNTYEDAVADMEGKDVIMVSIPTPAHGEFKIF